MSPPALLCCFSSFLHPLGPSCPSPGLYFWAAWLKNLFKYTFVQNFTHQRSTKCVPGTQTRWGKGDFPPPALLQSHPQSITLSCGSMVRAGSSSFLGFASRAGRPGGRLEFPGKGAVPKVLACPGNCRGVPAMPRELPRCPCPLTLPAPGQHWRG